MTTPPVVRWDGVGGSRSYLPNSKSSFYKCGTWCSEIASDSLRGAQLKQTVRRRVKICPETACWGRGSFYELKNPVQQAGHQETHANGGKFGQGPTPLPHQALPLTQGRGRGRAVLGYVRNAAAAGPAGGKGSWLPRESMGGLACCQGWKGASLSPQVPLLPGSTGARWHPTLPRGRPSSGAASRDSAFPQTGHMGGEGPVARCQQFLLPPQP